MLAEVIKKCPKTKKSDKSFFERMTAILSEYKNQGLLLLADIINQCLPHASEQQRIVVETTIGMFLSIAPQCGLKTYSDELMFIHLPVRDTVTPSSAFP